jgi:hypothetical protein
MGHFTVLADSADEALATATLIKGDLVAGAISSA